MQEKEPLLVSQQPLFEKLCSQPIEDFEAAHTTVPPARHPGGGVANPPQGNMEAQTAGVWERSWIGEVVDRSWIDPHIPKIDGQ